MGVKRCKYDAILACFLFSSMSLRGAYPPAHTRRIPSAYPEYKIRKGMRRSAGAAILWSAHRVRRIPKLCMIGIWFSGCPLLVPRCEHFALGSSAHTRRIPNDSKHKTGRCSRFLRMAHTQLAHTPIFGAYQRRIPQRISRRILNIFINCHPGGPGFGSRPHIIGFSLWYTPQPHELTWYGPTLGF